MIGAVTATTPASQTTNPFEGASLPAARHWLSSCGLATEGLYLTPVLDTPRLFISDVASAGARELLELHQIGAILSLVPQPFERMTLSEAPGAAFDRYRVTDSTHGPYKDPNLARYFIPLRDDGTNTPQQLLAAFALLEDICRTHAKTGILVHCQAAGLSRSVSLVAALIAKSLKCSFEEAVGSLATHRVIRIHEDLAMTLTHALGIQLERGAQ